MTDAPIPATPREARALWGALIALAALEAAILALAIWRAA